MSKSKEELKTLKDLGFDVWIFKENKKIPMYPQDQLKQEAIKDLLNIYELEKMLGMKLNDENILILNKYIMWKNNITEEDLKEK